MPTPGWFRETFEAYVLEIMQMNQRGQKMNPYDGADILWEMIYRQSERMTARALEELFGSKELPIAMPGGIISRTHVDRIAKHLVNRGGVVGDDSLFPEGVDKSSTEGTAYANDRERWRPTYDGAGRRPGYRNKSDENFRREYENRWQTDEFFDRVHEDLEQAARNAMQRPNKHVGFADEEGRVT